MRATNLTRRGALAALAAAALTACNAPQQAAVQSRPAAAKPAAPAQPAAPATPAVKIATITVDTSALPALSSDPTAAWVQSALPGALARALEPNMAPGDPDGATLDVQISSVVLGMIGAGSAIDSISGVATLSGGGAAPTTVTLDATAAYAASPSDQTLWQPARQRRIDALTRAFADWLPRKLQL